MRRAIVFSVDALAAFLILTIALGAFALMRGSFVSPMVENVGVHAVAQDAVSVLAKMRVYDVRHEPGVDALFMDGALSSDDLNKSVLEVLGGFWAANNSGNFSAAGNLSRAVLSPIMPEGVQWAVRIEDDIIYNTTEPSVNHSLAVSRRLVSGVAAELPSTGCVARAFVERIRGKHEKAYAFFGGFTGEGNITAVVRGVPADAQVENVVLEINAGDNLSLYANGAPCGTFTKTPGNYSVDSWTVYDAVCLAAIANGSDNNFSINFTGSVLGQKYAGGGFVAVTYNTSIMTPPPQTVLTEYLPGIDGLINTYSSFYVPGTVTLASAHLRFLNNYTTLLFVGNKTLMSWNGTNETQTVDIPNANFSAAFPNYAELSQKNVPVRLKVVANVTGGYGNADVVLITDVSGSMDWRMDSDSTFGVNRTRTCNDTALYTSGNSQRMSVARCVDRDFVDAVMEGVGNKVALVSFSTGITNYTELTNNSNYLKSVIDDYEPTDSTCICCAINKAYDILAAQSGANRTRFIVVMSDGVPNVRCTPTCSADFRAVSMYNETLGFATGVNGMIYGWNGTWNYMAPPSTSYDLYGVSARLPLNAFSVGESGKIYEWLGASWLQDIDMGSSSIYAVSTYNSTLAFSVGASGKINRWLGGSWSEQTDTGSTTWYGTSVYNGTLAFAVGDSGKIERWLGGSWSEQTDTGSNTFYAVKAYNGTLAFAVGDSGKIYRWLGGSWSEQTDTGSNTFYAVDVWNGSLAFAVGSSGGIYRWLGGAWVAQASPTTSAIRGVSFVNGSFAKAVTSGGEILSWNGVSWTEEWQYQCDNGNYSAGSSCSDSDSCATATSCPSRNSNYSSCRAKNDLNATAHAVGFGPVASCNFANNTLYAVAQCGQGLYFASSNASELADFYRSLARTIVQASNASQIMTLSGSINSTLFPDSYLEFHYVPSVPEYEYQELEIQRETPYFASCQGDLYVPLQMRIDSARVTSFSSAEWTANVTLKNSAYDWLNVFNLSVYNGSTFIDTGDPFFVSLNHSLLRSGEHNYLDVRLQSSPGNQSATCSQKNRAIYEGRIRAAVNYSGVFIECRARNATIYYDLDYDSAPDGYVNVTIGADLPSAGADYVTVDQLDTSNNAVDDALQRLLTQLNIYTEPTDHGPAGSIDNPVDVQLDSEVGSSAVTGQGIPFLWGPSEVEVMVWT
ncbi:von Willebrand factor type A domain protein [Candidatus Norongarragalina meridionalis]|nr:von Willebrand factor type A domain protein [Candidatus Norongarragalina meridionalis]